MGGAIADLNGDGTDDLVVANHYNGMNSSGVNSTIYYGSPAGWSLRRQQMLPTPFALSVAAGDFDGDGRLDLAFACTTEQGAGRVRVFLQTELGFEPKRFADTGIRAVQLCAADLDGDGCDDLVVLDGRRPCGDPLGRCRRAVVRGAHGDPGRGGRGRLGGGRQGRVRAGRAARRARGGAAGAARGGAVCRRGAADRAARPAGRGAGASAVRRRAGQRPPPTWTATARSTWWWPARARGRTGRSCSGAAPAAGSSRSPPCSQQRRVRRGDRGPGRRRAGRGGALPAQERRLLHHRVAGVRVRTGAALRPRAAPGQP